MPFRSSRKNQAAKAKEAVTEQVSDRTDDLVAALDAAMEALARASAAAERKREAARRRNRKLMAGAAGLTLLGVAFSRLTGGKGDQARLERQAEHDAGWVAESTSDAGPAPSAEVTQLHGNGAGADAARTPPAN